MKSLSVVEQIRRDKARAERLRELQREAKQAEAALHEKGRLHG